MAVRRKISTLELPKMVEVSKMRSSRVCQLKRDLALNGEKERASANHMTYETWQTSLTIKQQIRQAKQDVISARNLCSRGDSVADALAL